MLKPKAQGVVGLIADYLMLPVMYLLQGNFTESPQRTHRWNNSHLKIDDLSSLDADMVESVPADSQSSTWWVLCHIFTCLFLAGGRLLL